MDLGGERVGFRGDDGKAVQHLSGDGIAPGIPDACQAEHGLLFHIKDIRNLGIGFLFAGLLELVVSANGDDAALLAETLTVKLGAQNLVIARIAQGQVIVFAVFGKTGDQEETKIIRLPGACVGHHQGLIRWRDITGTNVGRRLFDAEQHAEQVLKRRVVLFFKCCRPGLLNAIAHAEIIFSVCHCPKPLDKARSSMDFGPRML